MKKGRHFSFGDLLFVKEPFAPVHKDISCKKNPVWYKADLNQLFVKCTF